MLLWSHGAHPAACVSCIEVVSRNKWNLAPEKMLHNDGFYMVCNGPSVEYNSHRYSALTDNVTQARVVFTKRGIDPLCCHRYESSKEALERTWAAKNLKSESKTNYAADWEKEKLHRYKIMSQVVILCLLMGLSFSQSLDSLTVQTRTILRGALKSVEHLFLFSQAGLILETEDYISARADRSQPKRRGRWAEMVWVKA